MPPDKADVSTIVSDYHLIPPLQPAHHNRSNHNDVAHNPVLPAQKSEGPQNPSLTAAHVYALRTRSNALQALEELTPDGKLTGQAHRHIGVRRFYRRCNHLVDQLNPQPREI